MVFAFLRFTFRGAGEEAVFLPYDGIAAQLAFVQRNGSPPPQDTSDWRPVMDWWLS